MLKVLKDPVFDGMPKHRVKAYDATDPLDENKIRSFIEIPDNPNMKEYACLLSHLKALIQFSKSKYSNAIIFEDDICMDFKPYWQETIQKCIHHAPSDWELLQLSCIEMFDKYPKKLYTPTKNFSSALSYVVNKKGVLRFLKHFHLDKNTHVTDYVLFNQMKSYTYQYPFFIPTTKDSEIHPEHVKKYHLPNKQKMGEFLRTRPFPLKDEILYVSIFKRDSTLSKLPNTLILYVKKDDKKYIPFLPNLIVRDFDEVTQSNQKYSFLSYTKYLYPHYQFYSWVDL